MTHTCMVEPIVQFQVLFYKQKDKEPLASKHNIQWLEDTYL